MLINDLINIKLLKSKEMFKNNLNNKIKIKIFIINWKKIIIN